MAEKIDWTKQEALSVILANAMSEASEKSGCGLFETFKLDLRPDNVTECTNPDVVMLVNGVEVPFVQELKRMLQHLEASFDEQVHKAAVNLLSGSRLRDLAHKLDMVEWEIEQAVSSLRPGGSA